MVKVKKVFLVWLDEVSPTPRLGSVARHSCHISSASLTVPNMSAGAPIFGSCAGPGLEAELHKQGGACGRDGRHITGRRSHIITYSHLGKQHGSLLAGHIAGPQGNHWILGCHRPTTLALLSIDHSTVYCRDSRRDTGISRLFILNTQEHPQHVSRLPYLIMALALQIDPETRYSPASHPPADPQSTLSMSASSHGDLPPLVERRCHESTPVRLGHICRRQASRLQRYVWLRVVRYRHTDLQRQRKMKMQLPSLTYTTPMEIIPEH